eukprot:CAMPEP_0172629240 /NCGR_PEP_ID=MMETSP1068-20121228/166402_1 /TAXON_ID=35684 /ORGANISM="Pseudopedinella elastica, Strain CCMP716" /LENGTH=223 /DNA_ID=CAMNT_0013439699 /DNA_START=45 /DNA_END=716 /DNA_ORIENTATION=-
MTWSEKAYRPAMAELLGAEAAANFRARENDYVIGDLKFGGNAQAVTRRDWVHHTSFLWDFDPTHMELLTQPAKQPKYRANRGHLEFLTTLKAETMKVGGARHKGTAAFKAEQLKSGHERGGAVLSDEKDAAGAEATTLFWPAVARSLGESFELKEVGLDACLEAVVEPGLKAAGFDGGLVEWSHLGEVSAKDPNRKRRARTYAVSRTDLEEIHLPRQKALLAA